MPTIDDIRSAFSEPPTPAKPIANIFGVEVLKSPFMPTGFIGIRGGTQTGFVCPDGKVVLWDNDRFRTYWRSDQFKSPAVGRFDGVRVSVAVETLKAEVRDEPSR